MNCDVCQQNQATVFLTQIVDGKTRKANLCEACAKEKDVVDPLNFALCDMLHGIGTAKEMEQGATAQRCPACGFTQQDFKKTGRLGCATCYTTFAEGLTTLLKGMHKGTEHVGKVPARQAKSLERATQLKTLQRDLRKAVSEEDYESAASIRDQIRLLNTE